jgi:polar amino acid transport system substrate-binding protein
MVWTGRARIASYLAVPLIAVMLAACGSGTEPSSTVDSESGGASTQQSTPVAASTPSQQSSDSAESGSTADAGSVAELPADIKQRGYVNVGTFPDYPPGQFAEEGSNDLVGWNMDLAKALSDALGVEFRMNPTTFDSLIPGVIAKRYDLAMAEANITDERRKEVDFVTYLNNGLGLLVRKDSAVDTNDLQALCGRQVGTNRGASSIPLLEAASEKCQADDKKPITVTTYNQIAEAILAVTSNRVPVAAGDFQPISYAANQNPTVKLAGGESFNKVTAGIIFPKGSGLEAPIRDALNKLIEDGTYKSILQKWGVGSAAIDKAEILPAQ